ncbi:MAG: Exonuclease small subunit [Candidatus Parcubacteria bacterium]|jgi:exodeoxyribonuclease VII small subunit
MAKAAKQSGTSDFGAAYKELEDIVAWFEREDVDLEEGLKRFERGLELAKLCKDRLKEVENKVTEIKAKFGAAEEEKETGALF